MNRTAQFAMTLGFVALVFYWLASPPEAPASFSANNENLISSRNIYDPQMGAALDQGLRDFWQKPDQVLEALGDLTGLKIADIGCGEGYFSLRLLDKVGPEGLVYATDIQPSVLQTLADRIPQDQKERVRLVLSKPDDLGIYETVDLILVVQVLAEVENQREFLQQLRAIMDDRTRLLIIDSKHITDPTNGFTRPVNLKRLFKEILAEGFRPAPEFEFAISTFLPKQFFLVVVKG